MLSKNGICQGIRWENDATIALSNPATWAMAGNVYVWPRWSQMQLLERFKASANSGWYHWQYSSTNLTVGSGSRLNHTLHLAFTALAYYYLPRVIEERFLHWSMARRPSSLWHSQELIWPSPMQPVSIIFMSLPKCLLTLLSSLLLNPYWIDVLGNSG